MVPSLLAASTTMRSSQNASESRQSPMFAASSLVMMIALNRGTPVPRRRKVSRAGLGGPARPRQHAAGAVARHEVDEEHLPAVRLDDVVTNNILSGVVAALHQHSGAHLLDQFERRVFFEYDDEIDRLQRGEHVSARGHVLNRAALALQPRHRAIAVAPDNKAVAGRARRRHEPR